MDELSFEMWFSLIRRWDPTKKKGDAKPRPTLNGLSFDIQPGQVVAVVGHTGAGKSTIAQLIPRLYDPNAGQVLIDGHDIREFTLESLRAQMSMVLQESILFTGSIVENIAYGRPDATGTGNHRSSQKCQCR